MTLKAICYALRFKTHASFGVHHENLNEDRPILSAMKMQPMTLVSGNIMFMRIFVEVPWRRGVKRQWRYRKHEFSGLSDATSSAPQEMRPTLLHSIIQSFVAFPQTPKYAILNDLEWFEWPFYVKFSLARTDIESINGWLREYYLLYSLFIHA